MEITQHRDGLWLVMLNDGSWEMPEFIRKFQEPKNREDLATIKRLGRANLAHNRNKNDNESIERLIRNMKGRLTDLVSVDLDDIDPKTRVTGREWDDYMIAINDSIEDAKEKLISLNELIQKSETDSFFGLANYIKGKHHEVENASI